ncbi:MAG: shikimate kinase, partial [Bacteroidota bacterium]
AVGKMTVGQTIADAMEYSFSHNHHSLELANEMFDWGTPEFKKISEGVRQLVFDVASGSEDIKGFIYSLVVDFERESDWEYVRNIIQKFSSKGWDTHVLELLASLEKRLERNDTPYRKERKATKRDVARSKKNILDWYDEYRLNSNESDPINDFDWHIINNDNLSADEVAKKAIAAFNLK